MSLFFVPLCNSEVLVFPGTTWFFSFQVVQFVSPKEVQKTLCLSDAWELFWHPQDQMQKTSWRAATGWSSSEQCLVCWNGSSPVQKQYVGLSLHCSHWHERRQEGKAFYYAFLWAHQRIVSVSHLYCVVRHLHWSKCKIFLHCLQLRTHVETRHLHHWKGLLDTRRKVSGSGLFRYILICFCDFTEKESGRHDLLSPTLPYFHVTESPYMFIKPSFCSYRRLCQRIESGQQSYR